MRAIAILFTCTTLILGQGATGGAYTRGEAPQPEVGEEFPDFTLPDVDGREVSLRDFRGKVILLSFWSCYTDTCFTSVRIIEALIRDYSAGGLVAPTVCSEIPPALAKNSYAELLKRCGAGQIILIDVEKKMKGRFNIRQVPTTFLIDRDQLLREKFTGVPPLMRKEFREAVRSLVAEEGASSVTE